MFKAAIYVILGKRTLIHLNMNMPVSRFLLAFIFVFTVGTKKNALNFTKSLLATGKKSPREKLFYADSS